MSKRPSNYLAMMEVPRAMMEFAFLGAAIPALHSVPTGDGHPVLVLPGFLGSDSHTSVLRQYLDTKGYRTYGWGQGTNLGMGRLGGIEVLLNKVTELFAENEKQPISLVGWSLGGVFARRIAMQMPEKVRQVICLGSPIGDPTQSSAFRAYSAINAGANQQDVLARYIARNGVPLPVPSTAIYSKTDGVVPHQIAKEVESEQTENIEVLGSHAGLVVNPQVFCLVGRKLAQEDWTPLT